MLHGCFFEGSQFHFVLLDAQLLELDGCEEHVLLPAAAKNMSFYLPRIDVAIAKLLNLIKRNASGGMRGRQRRLEVGFVAGAAVRCRPAFVYYGGSGERGGRGEEEGVISRQNIHKPLSLLSSTFHSAPHRRRQ